MKVRAPIFLVAGVLLVGAAVGLLRLSRPEPADSGFDLDAVADFRVGLNSIPKRLNINDTTSDINAYRILTAIHLGLVRHDAAGQTYPSAALRWQVQDAERRYIFDLNPDLHFHHGAPLTCRDVEATFAQLQTIKTILPVATKIASMGCLDEHRFFVLLERPSAIFLSWLGNLEASILPAAATRTGDTLDGLGPYRVEDEAVVAAGANLPALVLVDKHPLIRPWSPKRIHFVFEKTSAEGIAAVKSGSIDFFPLDGVLYESADLRVLRSKAFDKVWVLTLGKKVAPLLAADRRRCLFGAIDRSAFAPANQGGEGLDDYTEAYGVIPPGQPGRLTKDQLDATPPFAARCAETAPAIDLIYLDGFVGPGMLAWIQRELARVGVAVTPRGLAKRAFITAIVSSDYDLAFFAFGLDVIPEMTLSLFYRQSSPVPLVWMTSPAIDAQLDKTILAETKSERIALIGQFERDLARTPLLIPLLFERSRYLLGNCFKLHERVMSVGNEYFQEVGAIPGCRR